MPFYGKFEILWGPNTIKHNTISLLKNLNPDWLLAVVTVYYSCKICRRLKYKHCQYKLPILPNSQTKIELMSGLKA